jgi:uncharacterized coiled-coil protein SlyX
MTETSPRDESPRVDDRFERIESEVGFLAHEQDTLSDQILNLHSAIDALTAQMSRLESRLDGISTSHAQHGLTNTDGSQAEGEMNLSPSEPNVHQSFGSTETYLDGRPPHWGRSPGRE